MPDFDQNLDSIIVPDSGKDTVLPINPVVKSVSPYQFSSDRLAEFRPENVNLTGMQLATMLSAQSKWGTAEKSVSFKELKDNQRYGIYNPTVENQEDYKAYGQSNWDKAANGLTKGLVLVGTTIAGSVGLLAGVPKALYDGRLASIWDNPWMNGMDDLNKAIDDKYMPNYYTDVERNSKWYSSDNWFKANFFWDKLIKNSGFAVGAMLSGNLANGAIKGLGKGLGAIAGVAADATESAQAFKLFTPILRNASRAFSQGKNIEAAAIMEKEIASITDVVSQGSELGKIAKSTAQFGKVNDIGRRGLIALYSSAGEASFEALNTMKNYKNTLISKYEEDNGKLPEGEDLDNINAMSDNLGKLSFFGNMALLSATEYMQLPTILGSSYRADRQAANSLLGRANNVILKDGKYIAEKSSLFNRIIGRPSKYIFDPKESFQEVGQYALEVGATNYYNKKYRNEDADAWVDGMLYGVEKTVNSKEGGESFLLGGITGGLIQTGPKIQEGKQRNINTANLVSQLNSTPSFLAAFKERMDSINRAVTLNEDAQAAVIAQDKLESKDLEYDKIHNYLSTRIKYGRYDMIKDDLADLSNEAISDEGLAKLKQEGLANINDTKESFRARVENIEKQAININNLYQSLDMRYSGIKDEDGNRVYSPEVIDKMVYVASKVADYDVRIPELATSLIPTGVKVQTIVAMSAKHDKEDVHSLLQEANKTIDELDILEETKEEYKESLFDVAEMSARRKLFLDEYNKIKKAPTEFKEAAPKTEGELKKEPIKVKTKDGEETLQVGISYSVVSSSDTESGHKFFEFPNFKIIGINKDGTIKIQADNGNVRNVPPDFLNNYSIRNEQELVGNEKYHFFKDNVNKVGIYRDEDDKENSHKGRVWYNSKTDKIEFYYKNKNGKTVKTVIEEEDILENRFNFGTELTKKEKDQATSDVSALDKKTQDKLFKLQPKTTIDDVQNPPPGESENEEKRKDANTAKPISKLFSATIYNEKDNHPHNSRHQRFLLGVDSLPNRANILRIIITPNNEKAAGLEGITDIALGKTATQSGYIPKIGEEPILAVYIEETSEGRWYINEKGERIVKLGGKPNLDEVVFGILPTAELVDASGNDRYSKATPKEAEVYKKKAIEKRKELLAKTDSYAKESFLVSRGRAEKISGERNSVVGVLATKEDLDNKKLIVINNKGTVSHQNEDIDFPLGAILFKNGSTLEFLNNRNLTNSEINSVKEAFKLLIRDASKKDSEWNRQAINYLQGILYFASPYKQDGTKGHIGVNQIWFEKGNFVMGQDEIVVPFTLKSIDGEKFNKFLKGIYNRTNNALLKTNKTYEEITGIKEDGTLSSITWKSYQHYLLSDTYDLVDEDPSELKGKPRPDIPLTTDIRPLNKNIPNDRNYSYKYSYVQNIIPKEKSADTKTTAPKGKTTSNTITKTKTSPKVAVAEVKSEPAKEEKQVVSEIKQEQIADIERRRQEELVKEDEEIANWNEVLRVQPSNSTAPGMLNVRRSNIIEINKRYDAELANLKQVVSEETKVEANIVGTVSLTEKGVAYGEIKFETDEQGNFTPIGLIMHGKEEPITDKNRQAILDIITTKMAAQRETVEEVEKTDDSEDKIIRIATIVQLRKMGIEITSPEDLKLYEENKEKIDKRVKKDFKDSSYKLFDTWDVVRGNIEEEKAYIEEHSPFNTNLFKHLIDVTGGGFAWGEYTQGVINLFEAAKKGTGYHELFHGVFNSFTPLGERKSILKEYRERNKGTTFTEDEIEEKIADEFADFVNTEALPPKGKSTNLLINFFRKIAAFFKSLFNIDNYSTTAQLFRKIDAGYYKKYPKSTISNGKWYSVIPEFDEKDTQSIIKGVTSKIFQEIFKDGGNLIQFDENRYFLSEIYKKVYDELETYYKEDLQDLLSSQKASADEKKSYLRVWRNIDNNWGKVTELVEEYLRTFSIVTKLNENGDSEIVNDVQDGFVDKSEDEESEYPGGRSSDSYVPNPLKFDGRLNASASIKLLFATLTEAIYSATGEDVKIGEESKVIPEVNSVRDSTTMMEKMVQYAKTFNFIVGELLTLNTIEEKETRLKEIARTHPNYARLANRLKLGEESNKLKLDDWKLKVRFYNVMSKQRPIPLIQYIDENGNTTIGEANLEGATKTLVKKWIDSLKLSINSIIKWNSSRGEYTIDGEGIEGMDIKYPQDKSDFLKQFGIDFPVEMFNNLNKAQKEKFNSSVSSIKFTLAKKVTSAKSSKTMEVSGPFKTLAQLYIKAQGHEWESTYTNIEGELIQEIFQGNTISNITNDINNSTTFEDLLRRLPQLEKPFAHGSVYINEQFKGIQWLVKYIQGTIDRRKSNISVPGDKLSDTERLMQEINQNIQGNYDILINADSKTQYMLGMGNYIEHSKMSENLVWDTIYKVFDGYYQVEKEMFAEDGKKRTMSVFSEDYSNENIHDGVRDFIQQRADEQIRTLLDFGIINQNSDKTTYEITTLDDNFAKSEKLNKNKLTQQELAKLFNFRTVNYMINNIEMHKIYFGDPAEYGKDITKRWKSSLSPREASIYGNEDFNNFHTTHYNSIQPEKGKPFSLKEGDPGYWKLNDVMSTATMQDNITETESITNDVHLPDNIRLPYKESNGSDSQGWALLPAYREMRIRSGRWNNNTDETQYQYNMALDRINMEEDGFYKYSSNKLKDYDIDLINKGNPNVAFFPPLKPIATGVTNDNNPLLDKYSIAPLTYTWVRKRAMASHYIKMLKQNISYIIVQSGRKVGTRGNNTFYNEDGTVNSNPYENLIDISYRYFGIQVETNAKKNEGPRGSQLTKIATVNLYDGGRALSPKIEKLVQRNKELLIKSADEGYFRLLDKFGITENEDGYLVADKQKVLNLLVGKNGELSRRELATNIKDALKIDPTTNDFVTPFEALNNYQQIKSVLYSYVDKYIASPKVNGGPKIQISGTAWENTVINGIKIKKGKDSKENDVWVSNGLKFYEAIRDKEIGEIKSVAKMEIMLPNWFAKKLRAAGINVNNDELIKFLNETAEGRDLLSGIGFRIPTQGLNSIDVFIVKGFLPEEMGDSVVVPEALTTKAGSDFDVDKLNTYLKNIYIKNKSVVVVPYFNTREESDEFFENEFFEILQFKIDKKEDKKEGTENLINTINSLEEGTASKKSQSKWIPILRDMRGEDTHEEFYDRLQSSARKLEKDIEKLNDWDIQKVLLDEFKKTMYRKSLENEYFRSLEELILLPENFEQLITPNTSKGLTDIRGALVGISEEEFGEGAIKSIFNPMYMSKVRHNFITGKGGVAIAAIAQTNNALNQLVPTYIDSGKISGIRDENEKDYIKNAEIGLPHNTIDIEGTIYASFSSRLDRAGKFISDKISQYINGFVDISKDAFITQIIKSPSLTGTFLMLEKLGVPSDMIAYFMNQPIIRAYIKSVQQTEFPTFLFNSKNIDKIKGKFVKPKTMVVKEFKNRNDVEGLTAHLKDNIKSYYGKDKKAFTNEQNAEQHFILDEFLKYQVLASHLLKYIQGTNYDTANFSDSNILDKKLIQTEIAENEIVISSAQKMLDGTWIGNTQKNLLNSRSAISNTLFKIEADEVRRAYLPVINELARMRMSTKSFQKAARQVEQAFIDYAVQTQTKLNEKISYLLVNEATSAATELVNVKNTIPKGSDLDNNLILNEFLPIVGATKNSTKNITLANKVYDAFTSNLYTGAFRQLKKNPHTEHLYGSLLRVAFLQSGVRKSAISFTEIIPNEDFKNFIIPVINNLKNEEMLNGFTAVDAFYRNEWNNKDVVPRIQNNWQPIDPNNPEGQKYIKNKWSPKWLTDTGVKFAYKVSTKSAKAGGRYVAVVVTKQEIVGNKAEIDRRKKAGIPYQDTILLRRIDDNTTGLPLRFPYGFKGHFNLYAPVNAWGDSIRGQEFYTDIRPSQYENNTYRPPIEADNKTLVNSFNKIEETTEETPQAPENQLPLQEKTMKVTKIISGGQTGIDRMGLEIGKELGIETGGVAPKGYKTEKGKDITLKEFGLTEHISSSYDPRTEENVKNSDGSVLFGDVSSAGSKLTESFLKKNKKPYIVNPTSEQLKKFLSDNNIAILNVAGNRASKLSNEKIEQYRKVLRDALSSSQGEAHLQIDDFEEFKNNLETRNC